MRSIKLASPRDFAGWRVAARALIEQRVAPENVSWSIATQSASLFDDEPHLPTSDPRFTVPKQFVQLASAASLHTDKDRFALLYRLLWRLREEPRLLDVSMDVDVHRIRMLAKAVQRDMHKMKAFVRFRRAPENSSVSFIAWFEPTYHIVEVTAPFFARRFANDPWAILTPDCSAFWNTQALTFGPGAHRSDAPADDAAEDLWRQYYTSIFNPARLKVKAMQAEMPQKYWHNLPESSLIPKLIASAQQRTQGMLDQAPTIEPKIKLREVQVREVAPHYDTATSITELRASASACKRCPLWQPATQTVFGEGPENARIVLVGEQPGDQEDLAGKPFVGPAGRLLDRALRDAGLDRDAVYVTNAVKHFKYEPRGKRRLHKTPAQREVAACSDWLHRELAIVKPELIVLLGATAATSVLKRTVTIERSRGEVVKVPELNTKVLVTVHPSYLLRIPKEQQAQAYARFVDDLQLASPFSALQRQVDDCA